MRSSLIQTNMTLKSRAISIFIAFQASTLTQTVTGPVGPVTPRICWSSKIFTGPTIFYFKCQIFAIMYQNNKKKFTDNIHLYCYFIIIYFKNRFLHSHTNINGLHKNNESEQTFQYAVGSAPYHHQAFDGPDVTYHCL